MPRTNKKKTILLTGGSGFIGSNLIPYLLSDGDKVICLDNLSTGSINNIESFLDHKDFEFIEHDICHAFKLDEHIDQIYNLASLASPIHYQSNPIQTTKTAVIGAYNMLELAHQHNSVILQASTSEVYGDPETHPQKEEYWGNVNPVGIRSCYDEGKRCAESLFFDFWREKGVKIKVARIFNTFGPKMQENDGRVVSNFIVQALKNIPITIYGKGTQTRAFCYVEDMAKGLKLLMNSTDDIIGPINLGSTVEYQVFQLAEKVIKKTGSHSKVIFEALPEDDPVKRLPDITKANDLLNWKPKVDIDLGLNKTIDFFKEIIVK